MEEDTEELDWGNEDDEQQHVQHRSSGDVPEEAEDAVSLGGDEDDMQAFYAYQSRSDQDNSKGPPLTAKSAHSNQQHHKRELQRENSGSSQNVASQSSSQNPPLRRSQSHSKLTHALPPKPVLVSASSHSVKETSTLASAMAPPDKGRRPNGKPPSSTDDQLPPDWEVRHPRNGSREVYYYNIKTQESTWSRPMVGKVTSLKDKERGRSQTRDIRTPDKTVEQDNTTGTSFDQSAPPLSARAEAAPAVPTAVDNLSYEDRHYRPGGSPQKGNAEAKREDRPTVKPSHRPRSETRSPRSPQMGHLDRLEPSPFHPLREHQDRPSRSRRESVGAVDRGLWRESERDGSREVHPEEDRTWIPRNGVPPDPLPIGREDHSVYSRRKRQDMGGPPDQVVPIQDRNARRDVNRSSPPRHRSPPPHMQPPPAWPEQGPRTNVPRLPPRQLSPAPSSLLRQKSRFDRPASPPIQDMRLQGPRRDHDVYVPPDSTPQRRGREPELTSAQIGGENEAKRRRTDEYNADSAIARRSANAETSRLLLLPERPIEEPSLSPVELSRSRRRQPLPPQSERFREASKHPTAAESPTRPPPPAAAFESAPSYAPLGPRDSGAGMIQRSANVNSAPSGPRQQHQVAPLRDANHPDFAQGVRPPPSGPSATAQARSRNSRLPNEPAKSFIDSPVPRNRDATDIDVMASSRVVARSSQGPVRWDGRGEGPQDVLPKGPRAMASRIATGTGYTSASPTSPATPHFAQRPSPGQEHVPQHGRGRSPPPPLSVNDGWSGSREQPEGAMPRGADNARNYVPRDLHDRPVADVRNPVRPDMQTTRRQDDGRVLPAGPLPKLSGTNIVPIGNRRPFGAAAPSQASYPPSPLADHYPDRTDPERELPKPRFPVDDGRPKGSYERDRDFESRPPLPAEAYNPDVPRRMASRSFPPISDTNYTGDRALDRNRHAIENTESASFAARGRRDTRYEDQGRQTRFGPQSTRTHSESYVSEPRIWTPREPSPQTRAGYPQEVDYRTPPPRSRDSSIISSWPAPQEITDNHGSRVRPSPRGVDSRVESGSYHSLADDRHPQQRHKAPRTEHDRDYYDAGEIRRPGHSSSVDRIAGGHYVDRYTESQYPPEDTVVTQSRQNHREVYHEVPARPRLDARDTHFVEDRPGASWDRPDLDRHQRPDPPVVAPMKVYPGGVRNLNQDVTRMSKPVRIRRPPPPDRSQPPLMDFPPPDNDVYQASGRSTERAGNVREINESYQRPNIARRGGSLLDRLSLGPVSAPSLRDRVQVEDNRDRSNVAEPLVMEAEYPEDGGDDALMDAGSKRAKRRPGKPRRGRRSGP